MQSAGNRLIDLKHTVFSVSTITLFNDGIMFKVKMKDEMIKLGKDKPKERCSCFKLTNYQPGI
jgi:hypothetical protein